MSTRSQPIGGARSTSWIPLASVIDGRDNNINFLRMLAATMVLFGHCFDMLWRIAEEPLQHLLNRSGPYTAVNAFFVLSGLLISRSWIGRSTGTNFFWLRFIRIYPALWCCIVFCVALGLVFTSLDMHGYIRDYRTIRFLGLNATMLYKNAEQLPGIFPALRWPETINGPLWTLPYELKLYLSVALAGLVGLLSRRRLVFLAVVILGLTHTAIQAWNLNAAGQCAAWVRLVFYYYAGVSCFLYRDRISLNGKAAVLASGAVLAVAFFHPPAAGALFDLLLPYLLLVTAFIPAGFIRRYNQLGDYSYGTYIYAFPVQQSLLQLIPGVGPYPLFFMAFGITLVLAMVSWYLVEKPALRMRRAVQRPADLFDLLHRGPRPFSIPGVPSPLKTDGQPPSLRQTASDRCERRARQDGAP